MNRCAAYSCSGNGFRFNAVTDSRFFDLLATGNSLRGFYLSNSGENDLTNCSAVFNGVDGFFIDGTVSVGMTTLTACSTDRNAQSGILISQSGTQPIQIIAPRLRRDGSGSTSNNYAGLRLSGGAGIEVVPVDVVAPQVTVGVDDGGGGSETPQFAVRALRAQRLTIHGGDLWGASSAFSDGGNNTTVEWSHSTYWAAGAIGAKARTYPTPIGQSFMDLVEQTEPAAPSANTARLFVQDNGGGKTQLMVRFSSGISQQVAIQP
jgi:parallel beta-helix repeat protein